jgi:hypothetical protein
VSVLTDSEDDFSSSTSASESDSPYDTDDTDTNSKSSLTHLNMESSVHLGTSITVICGIVLIFSLTVRNNITKSSMIDIFAVIGVLLPVDHLLPSYSASRRALLAHPGIRPVTFDICVCGLTMFRDKPARFDPDGIHQLHNTTHCSTCGVQRVDLLGIKTTTSNTHIGITDQLATLFWDSRWRETTVLVSGDGTETMSSIHDSPPWISFLRYRPDFVSVPTNLLLVFCTDGFNPLKKSNYTM